MNNLISTTVAKNYRYPGPDSFRDDATDSLVFFGRDEEIAEVLNRLLSNKLLVMYAKSGLGKTSLLQAGLFPKLRELDFLPIRLRFNHGKPPMDELRIAVADTCRIQQILYTEGEGDSYWEFFNTAVFSKGQQFLNPVLILDQFEEIFTLPSLRGQDYPRKLGEQLGNLLSGQMPENLRSRLRTGDKPDYAATPPDIRVLMSLREDSVGALQDLSSYIPGILSQRFRLTPLDPERALTAIVEPAKRNDPERFIAAPFCYKPAAVEAMLTFLRGPYKRNDIEPFQLQLLCRHVELQVIARQSKHQTELEVDDPSYLGGKAGMDAVIKRFYKDAIAGLPGWRNRSKARDLCETGLLNVEGRRESLSKTQIKSSFKLNEAVLNQLVEKKVLRREERLDSHAFELSHDSLALAVFKSRKSKLQLKWLSYTLLIVLFLTGAFFWQRQQTVYESNIANAYKQQVIDLVALDRPDAPTIKQPKMVRIPGGSFQRGSSSSREKDEKPVRLVAIQAFSIGAYEVTFEEYDQFAATTPSAELPDDRGWGRGKRPVINVSWQDANAYATWLSEKTGKHYRLPTEAEWEYAARAGSTGDYFWGDADAKDYAWFSSNAGSQTHPAGEKVPNGFGLYDTSGNVWEWVQDCYAEDYKQAPTNGSAWEPKDCLQGRVLRGGSWNGKLGNLRSANRFGGDPGIRGNDVGFRLAQD